MAFRSVFDVALHFETFRNVDLFHQGLYHLRVRVYREEKDDERLSAVAYGHSTAPTLGEQKATTKGPRVDHHNLIPGFLTEEESSFCTRSFLIRYCEEEVELNEIAQFRLELAEEHLQHDVPLMFEVELMFADLTQHGGADRFGEQPDVESTEFKGVCTQTFRVHGPLHGLHEYCPVVFDEFHFAIANVSVHTVLIDTRFRSQPLQLENSKSSKRNTMMTIDDAKNEVVKMVQMPAVLATQNAPLTFSECLFGKTQGRGQDELLLIAEVFYQTHLQLLARSYTGLLAWFREVSQKCLTAEQRKAFGEVAEELDELLIGSDLLRPFRPFQDGTGPAVNGHNLAVRKYLLSVLTLPADAETFSTQIVADLNLASCQILGAWQKTLNLMHYGYREVATVLRVSWEQRMSKQWSQYIHTHEVGNDVMAPTSWLAHHDKDHVHQTLEELQKPKNGVRPAHIEDVQMCAEAQPVTWEQRYSAGTGQAPADCDDTVPCAPKEYRGVHLWVLVHGFQGNAFDMRLFKNNIALVYPEAIFLTSTSNEDNTDGDFHEMGIRLAQEVVNYVTDWCPGSALGKLSFVGYSIGGIIIRTALPHLTEYHSKFYTYISLTSMHFGYVDSQTTTFNTVLYALGHWRKIKCIQQLSMSEVSDPKDSFLYKLSKMKGLERFRWICLLSSKQDNYSPVHSSGAAMNQVWQTSADKYKETYMEMCQNFWEGVDPTRVLRLGTHFHIAEKNLDAAIGRVAHIRFIENQALMKMLIHTYNFLFR